jgi:hypothetical protein
MAYEKATKFEAKNLPGIIKVGHFVTKGTVPKSTGNFTKYEFLEVGEIYPVEDVKVVLEKGKYTEVDVIYTETFEQAQLLSASETKRLNKL